MCSSIKSKMAADGHLGYTKMAITSQPLCRSTWCFRVSRSHGATFSDLEWPRTPVLRSQYSLKMNISQTVHPSTPSVVLGKGFRGRRIEWRYFRFNNIQDGGWRPSCNSRHLRMTVLSRVTLASAGLSCIYWVSGYSIIYMPWFVNYVRL